MKILKFLSVLVLSILAASCSKETASPASADGTENLSLIKTISSGNYSIELFSTSPTLKVGYNKVYLRLKDLSGNAVNNVSFNWQPIMHMTTMQHSAPYSLVTKIANTDALYGGYIVFSMAGNSMEYWELTINYSVNNVNYSVTDTLNVAASASRNLESFTGTDGVSYLLALVDPAMPAVAVNDMSALLFKMDDMMSYSSVSGYTIAIDPRMPSMGNHSSPNNVNLVQSSGDSFYRGKLSLTMTGYWKISLQVMNTSGSTIQGQPITETNESSNIYFEVEF